MGVDVVEWLQARLARMEHQANRASELQARDWSVPSTGVVDLGDDLLPTGDRDVAEHIALHDPAAVLRRVAADREQLAEHAPTPHAGYIVCHECSPLSPADAGVRTVSRLYPCRTVLLLAEGWGWEARR